MRLRRVLEKRRDPVRRCERFPDANVQDEKENGRVVVPDKNIGDMSDTNTKPLGRGDPSCPEFIEECLEGCPNYGLNFDRVTFDHSSGRFVVFEFQKVDEWQTTGDVTPWSSHPTRYWHKCWRKYMALWRAVQKLEADFYIVNYAEPRAKFSNEVRVMQILSLDRSGIKKWSDWKCTRTQFGEFLRQMNARCQGPLS